MPDAEPVRLRGPARWRDIDPSTAYAIARLRVDVFVVEQECPYPELDGRDLEPGAEHRWLEADAGDGSAGAPVLACLRVLEEPDGSARIGRVVTAPAARGAGLSGVLMDGAVMDHGGAAIVLDAQAHLAHWYARWGFAADGPGFLEDGIPHVPMRRQPT